MIHLNSKDIAIAMAILSFSALGCGSNNPVAAPPISVVAVAPNGAVIQPNGMVGGPVGNGQCVPLTQSIGFQATGLYTDNFQTVYAGMVPYVDTLVRGGGQFGQVMASAGGVVGPVAGARMIQTSPGVHPDGTVMMNIMSTTPQVSAVVATPGYGQGTGVIAVSPTKLSIIYGLFGLSYPNVATPYTGSVPGYGFPNMGMSFNTPGMTPAQLQAQVPCVSSIAISLSFASAVNNYIDGGRVYLYLNGSSHGDYLQF